MNDFQDNSLEAQPNQFPIFPVAFKPQESNIDQEATTNQTKQIKLPEKQIKQLLGKLDKKYETIYPQFFKETWKDSCIDNFFQIYKPLNQDFISQIKLIKQKLKIVRISTHKIYVGQFKDSKCSGYSIVIFKNGNIYEGLMNQNKRDGKGIYIQANTGYFQGNFINDLKAENGIEVIYDKSVFKGNFLNGLRHQKGLFISKANNIIYYGQWKLGIMHGKGILKSSFSTYKGTLVNSLKHGHGEQIFSNGDTYRGDYQNNRFDGFGTYNWHDGASYEGSFKNGLRHGKGKWASGETKYSGSYAQGLKEGYGELYFPSGNFYKGNFVQDKREGYGEMFWTDGSFYKGDWKGAVQNGKGQIYLVGGEVISGLFENSILIQITPSIYEKQMQISTMGIHDLFGSQAQMYQPKNRTFSESKNIHSVKRRLTKIDESGRKKTGIKDKVYFKSPQKNQKMSSHHHHGSTHIQSGFPSFTHIKTPHRISHHHSSTHDHSHGKSGEGHQCKCQKRLQNFRLRHRLKTRQNESKVVDQTLFDDN